MIVGAVIKSWLGLFRLCDGQHIKIFPLALLFGFLGYLIAALMESSLQYSNPAILFWFMLAMVMSASLVKEQGISEGDESGKKVLMGKR